jgi:hypothetical protein
MRRALFDERKAQSDFSRMLKKLIAIGALTIMALGIAGCPALMLGSLGYTGYEYEKTGTLPGMPPKSHSPTNDKPNAQPTPSPNDIE